MKSIAMGNLWHVCVPATLMLVHMCSLRSGNIFSNWPDSSRFNSCSWPGYAYALNATWRSNCLLSLFVGSYPEHERQRCRAKEIISERARARSGTTATYSHPQKYWNCRSLRLKTNLTLNVFNLNLGSKPKFCICILDSYHWLIIMESNL